MTYTTEACGPFTLIRIAGNIDTEAATKALDDRIAGLRREGVHHFVFDLKQTSYLDSAGISIFIHCLCDVQENQGSIYIIAEESHVFHVLETVGISRLIKTYRNLKEFCAAHEIAMPAQEP